MMSPWSKIARKVVSTINFQWSKGKLDLQVKTSSHHVMNPITIAVYYCDLILLLFSFLFYFYLTSSHQYYRYTSYTLDFCQWHNNIFNNNTILHVSTVCLCCGCTDRLLQTYFNLFWAEIALKPHAVHQQIMHVYWPVESQSVFEKKMGLLYRTEISL